MKNPQGNPNKPHILHDLKKNINVLSSLKVEVCIVV